MKNTDCPFSLCLKLRNSPSPESETVDPYPCVVSLQWNHNHPVKSLQALGFKDIPSAVSERIMAMFKRGYTPGLAYREFIRTLTRECENDLELHKALADRSKIPRRPNFNQLFKLYKDEKYGAKDLPSMFKKLSENLKKTLEEEPEMRHKLNLFNEEEMEPLILVVITPLMIRVHEMVSCISNILV